MTGRMLRNAQHAINRVEEPLVTIDQRLELLVVGMRSRGPTARASRLSRCVHTVNPQRDLRNKAVSV